MNLTGISFTDLPPIALLQQQPETLLAALVSAIATLALIVFVAPRLAAPHQGPRVAASGGEAETCDFLINGGSVKALTGSARALLDGLGRGTSPLSALKQHLETDCPSIHRDIDALVVDGIGFRHHCPRGDGTAAEILGEPRGNAAILSIRPASEDARALQDARLSLERATSEIAFLRRVIDRAPILAWNLTPDDQIAWANAPYRERFDPNAGGLPSHRIANAFSHVIESVPLTSRGAEARSRMLVASPLDTEPQWYEVSEIEEAGNRLGYAQDTNELVAAEASLRRFVETLTETFAHLPIGLAVFDKNRRLGLFNPALTGLVKIDAVWLAGRPSLRDFLERLRETRQMPEQKDFTAWRRKLGELEEGARHGTYEENWMLPSGKVFRVTGRPHPQGALAFLFEDISATIMLERKYRSELELSQATLDKLNEAVAVFNASGSLVFVNTAFEALWGLDPMQGLNGPTIADMAELWAGKCTDSPVWTKLAEFATASETRTTWSEAVDRLDGRRLQILVAPLPDASALVVFRDLSLQAAHDGSEGEGDDMLAEFALEQIRIPVESAMKQVMSAIPAAQGAEAFKGLNAALQGLKDGLTRSSETRKIARARQIAGGAPLPALATALAERGLTLEVPETAVRWSARMRSAAMALGLAVADEAHKGSTVRITLASDETTHRLTVEASIGETALRDDAPSIAIARRIVAAGGGALAVSAADGTLALSATLPNSLAATPAARGEAGSKPGSAATGA
ncbi:MAG: PAS-domain containing protein [Rhodobacteraceae bacterium]|nr:PAS-domain containing protein [Paracoccaceae bacterium]